MGGVDDGWAEGEFLLCTVTIPPLRDVTRRECGGVTADALDVFSFSSPPCRMAERVRRPRQSRNRFSIDNVSGCGSAFFFPSLDRMENGSFCCGLISPSFSIESGRMVRRGSDSNREMRLSRYDGGSVCGVVSGIKKVLGALVLIDEELPSDDEGGSSVDGGS